MAEVSDTGKQVARQLQQIQKGAVDEFHKNLKLSMLLKDDMPDFLSSAPLAINFLGHLRLLAWSGAAMVDIVREPNSSFKSDRLSTNLVQLYQQGHKAFHITNENMNRICLSLQGLFGSSGTIFGILDCLMDPSSQSSVQQRMNMLSSGTSRCVDYASTIRSEMDTWGEMAAELERATNNEYATTERKIREHKLEQDLAAENKANVERLMNQCQKVLEIERKRYLEAQADVKKAGKKNRGWSSIGLVTLTSIANPILETVHHTTSLIGQTPNIVKDLSHATIGFGSLSKHDPSPQKGPVPASMDQQQVLASPNVVTNEVAYTKSFAISALVSDLQSLSESDFRSSKTKVRELLGQAEEIRRDVQPSSKPSRDACHILNGCQKVITEMLKESESSVSLNGASPSDKRRAERLEELKAAASGLELEANAQPGQAFGTQTPVLNRQTFVRDNHSIDANAFFNRRREDLARKELACAAALSNYEKKAEKHAATQKEITGIAHKLRRLHTAEVTTTEIRNVLRETGDIIGKLKGEMTKLSNYFISIKTMLEYLQEHDCQQFTTEIHFALERATPTKGILLSEFQAQIIYANLLTLRGYAGYIASSCDFYRTVSTKHFMPLFNAMYKLPLNPDDRGKEEAINQLEANTEKASKEVLSSGRNRILAMRDEVDQLGRAAHSQGEGLPLLPLSQKLALQTKARQVEEAESEKIDNTEMPTSTVNPALLLGEL
ncbi:hypothetical protein F5Y07DRAFT_407922 [Xylaria sp. FL0933]|nr:hypothetical protein F5Y07DRAFT_407922 [Xylaria sp. FL0933]